MKPQHPPGRSPDERQAKAVGRGLFATRQFLLDVVRILARHDGKVSVRCARDGATELQLYEHVVAARPADGGHSLVVQDDGRQLRLVDDHLRDALVPEDEDVEAPNGKLEAFIADLVCEKIPD